MTEWIESYRGTVSAWECDIVEHFTIAYYFDRFADATRTYLELIGEGETLGRTVGTGASRMVATFQHELRAGAAFHMQSAVVGIDTTTLQLGHQVIDSTTGTVVTWVAETLTLPAAITAASRKRLQALAITWPGPEIPAPTIAKAMAGSLTARDRVKPWEIADNGVLSLPDYVHRFSGAGMHFLTSIGMTATYMQQNRRGFSTFLLDLNLVSGAKVGDRIDVRTTVAHLGNTSLKYVHRMTGADGREIASMVQAGVQLDLDARRPSAIPKEIRDAISRQLAQG
ncbi:MAG: thioesterase family protein [Hyphomicrobiaceae bacterium]